MPKGKKNDSALNSAVINSQIGLQKMFALLASNQVAQVVLINKDGSAVAIQPSNETEKVTNNVTNQEIERYKHVLKDIKGDFNDLLLIKKGQNVEFSDNSVEVSTTNDGSLLDTILAVVREKVESLQNGLSISNKSHMILGKKNTINDLIQTAPNEAEATKMFETINKEFKLITPKEKDKQVTKIDESFQIVVPAAVKMFNVSGSLTFVPCESRLLITVDHFPGVEASHRIMVEHITYDGKIAHKVGKVDFPWKSTDVSLTEKQLVSSVFAG